MHRTTLSLDLPLLKEIKEIAQKEGKTLKKVISELLNSGLQARKNQHFKKASIPTWHSQKMEPLVNLEDKDALFDALDKK